jgi:ABC-type uncharacterized transport system involved in gliding motility auxiliary subunit|tara:strand:+ start:1531 stop:3402 length:1872 start_codon:yes stop_codon:yes gene_type:complete
MKHKVFSTSGLVLLVFAFLAFTVINNLFFSTLRVDLTENNLYTLSEGSKAIIDGIDETVNFYFFFSDEASEDLSSLRTFSKRVEELLGEYALYGDGKIKLHIIDPEPFSEAEDRAADFGLQGVPVNASGDELYLGLAGTNTLDDQAVIPFFQPDKEELLEYEISKLLHSLTVTKKPTIGLMSGLKIQGDMNMQTFQSTPPWMVVSQIEQLFEVESVDISVDAIDEKFDVLMVVHPKNMSETTMFAIDQFVLKGGHLLVFVDPLAETDRPQANPRMPTPPTQQSSELNRLLGAWGLELKANSILGDSQTALTVSAGPTAKPVRHLGIQGLQPANFAADDVITASLESINMATAGILERKDDAGTTIIPIITSSPYAMPLESFQFQFLSDPSDLQKSFKPTGEQYIVAARITGAASSAFPDGIEGAEPETETVTHADAINVIVVADTDLLSDRLWVQVQNFFGQRLASPFADNSDFVVNSLENLTGSSDLISVRSRGRFSRPFAVVQDLKREAEARYLQSANDLQVRLTETESKLSELQQSKKDQNLLSLSKEQEVALVQFQNEKIQIRKQLRDVRHQLDKDIEALGTTLKFINIALIPILLTLFVLAMNYIRLKRRVGNSISDQ